MTTIELTAYFGLAPARDWSIVARMRWNSIILALAGLSACATPDNSGIPTPGGSKIVEIDGVTYRELADGAHIPVETDVVEATADVPEGPAALAKLCKPGVRRCSSATALSECSWDGLGFVATECPEGQACAAEQCQTLSCDPNASLGSCVDGRRLEVCDGAGSGVLYSFCDASEPICFEGKCQPLACVPGERSCGGLTVINQCREDGTGLVKVDTCEAGTLCRNGQCDPICTSDFKENTYLGCEYWLVDLDNVEGGAERPVVAIVSNPSAVKVVSVVLTATDDTTPPVSATVPPLGQALVQLPTGYDLDGSGLSRRSFVLVSDGVVTVHSFNPLAGAGVFTTDASLLLPAHALGRAHLAMSWPQRQADSATGYIPVRGFVTIVATEVGVTEVKIHATADVEPSNTTPFIPAGTTHTIWLSRGDVVNLETGGGASGQDLTGTLVLSDRRVAAFSGHECANVPLLIQDDQVVGTNYCDHIEQQLLPIETLGTEYVADSFEPRGPADQGIWRVAAATSGVSFTTDPPGLGATGAILDVGEFVEFQTASDFVIRSTGPVLVGHYATGSNYEGFVPDPLCNKDGIDSGIGDPALTLTVPTAQFRKDHVVLSPDGYRLSYLNITHRVGTLVEVDGLPVATSEVAVGGSTWAVTRLPVPAGVHRIDGDEPVGVTVYGFDCDVSYAYPGGVNLEAKP